VVRFLRDGAARVGVAYRRIVEPRPSGLPNRLVVAWFPVLVALLGVVLVALHISGTSSGANFGHYGAGADPRLLWGSPKAIRTDEWLVHQGWVVSQAKHGFPLINGTFPGGMDTSAVLELPSWDWTAALRPHSWGFLLFGLEVGVAWQWWLPGVGLVTAAYLLVVTLLPRRPLTAAFVATGIFFCPIIQWWYGPNSIWPVAWSMLAMAATVWMLRDVRRWVRVLWAVVVGWLAVTAAIGLYVPFSVPCVLAFVLFFVGVVLQERPWSKQRAALLGRRLVPLLVAGASAAAVIGVFVLTRLHIFSAVSATVYPGQRSEPTGRLLADDPLAVGFLGAPFGQSFSATSPNILGPNPSESATVILIVLFLVPALLWFGVSRWRRERRVDWLLVTTLLTVMLFVAFMVIPGWDPVARALLLDKVPVSRLRVGFLALTPLVIALVVREVDSDAGSRRRALWRRHLAPAVLCAVVVSAACGYVAYVVVTRDPGVLTATRLWPITIVAVVLATCLLFFRAWIPTAAACFLIASVTIGAAVNPLYRGIFDLNETRIGQAVAETDESRPGTWVAVGNSATMAVLVSAGVDAYSGMQPYPSREMWHDIDPDGSDENAWNRLGYVRWTFGAGEPVSSNPVTDQIVTTFDACSRFAQHHVSYVLADTEPPTTDCLALLDEEKQGASDVRIYSVVAPGDQP
jgi:hypothetical protein